MWDQYISPAGWRMAVTTLVVAVGLLVMVAVRAYGRYRAFPCRIRSRTWFLGGPKMSVRISNAGRSMMEIDAPYLEFRRHGMTRRRFKTIAPGEQSIFPLGLTPQTGYDFTVDFIRLYDRDSLLRSYSTLYVCVSDKTHKFTRRKRVRLKKR